jgi:hypothetical protein
MAQPKRKRRSKHRGNAAGVVEARGRTGRAPVPSTTKADRRDRPPSWRSSMNRAAAATVLFVLVVVLLKIISLGSAIAIGAFMFALYVPLGYYTDTFVYKRRQAKLAGKA